MVVLDVHFFCFYLNFQAVDDFLAQKLHFVEHRIDVFAMRRARETLQEADEHSFDRRPITVRALLHGGRDELADVAPAKRQRLFGSLEATPLGGNLFVETAASGQPQARLQGDLP